MKDVSNKFKTYREAKARARVIPGEQGIDALKEAEVPKGNPYEITRTAVLSGIKKTGELIPYCHNLPVENCDVNFEIDGDALEITVRVSSVARTGMEMEALTGASLASLNIYDLLKPIDETVEISTVELVSKEGGYSDFQDEFIRSKELKAAVLVTSDGTYEGTREDKSGKILQDKLEDEDFNVGDYSILPDEHDQIKSQLIDLCNRGFDFIATTGGTGPGIRDVTVEATSEVIEREIPGLTETMRSYGHDRTPYAMFSRGLAGQRGKTLIVNFPGSSDGTREGLEALIPGLHHFFKMRGVKSGGHGEHSQNEQDVQEATLDE